MKKELQKAKAIEFLKELEIYEPYISRFKQKDKVCYFERFGGYWVYQQPEVETKMKAIEQDYDCKVYAITHEITGIGEMYSFLCVTENEEEWDTLLTKEDGNQFCAFAYVWNKDYEDCSEFGDVVVQSFGGGIRRIG